MRQADCTDAPVNGSPELLPKAVCDFAALPSLNLAQPCDLLWPIEYGRSDVAPVLSPDLKKLFASLSLFPSLPLFSWLLQQECA